ncbi:uncharacterized protein DS421_7g215890 [Arachis hypogaea]|nr:uncharacterized protein DS421_7g215890 [Arachis hypogaea]
MGCALLEVGSVSWRGMLSATPYLKIGAALAELVEEKYGLLYIVGKLNFCSSSYLGVGVEARHGLAENTMASNFDIVGNELDLNYDKPYEYVSEVFNSPVSNDDENRTTFDAFNKETEYDENRTTFDAFNKETEYEKVEFKVQKCHKNTTDLDANATTIGPPSDSVSKARKTKKKLPKKPIRTGASTQNQREEISVSQSAPPAEKPVGENSNDKPTPFRKKHKIIRPPAPCFVPPPIPAPGQTLWFKFQPSQVSNLMPHISQLQSNDSVPRKTTPRTTHDAISEKTMQLQIQLLHQDF